MNSAWEKNKGIDAYISDSGIAHFVENHFLKIHIKTKVVDHLVKHNYGISAFLPLNKTKSVIYFGLTYESKGLWMGPRSARG
jgi:hypothetical protein